MRCLIVYPYNVNTNVSMKSFIVEPVIYAKCYSCYKSNVTCNLIIFNVKYNSSRQAAIELYRHRHDGLKWQLFKIG